MPPIATTLTILAKYLNGIFHIKQLRNVCVMIKSDNERLMHLPEYEILQIHALEGRKLVVNFVVALAILLLTYLTLPTVLIVHDLVMKNETQDKYLMYPINYLIFEISDHYYLVTLHCYMSSIIITGLICPMDTLYIVFTQHVCAIFSVVGHRLKTAHILDADSLKKQINSRKFEKLLFDEQERMHEQLILCIKEHKRALECAQIVQSAFSLTLFFQILLNIICLSVTGVQALVKLTSGSFTDVLRLVIWMMGQYIHLLFIHLPGQRLSNFSEQVYYDALECMWYKFYTKTRFLYQFLLLNTLTPYQLTALKVTTLSMETFLSVTQAALSYFTVLSSTLY